jgi:hypothetical protein
MVQDLGGLAAGLVFDLVSKSWRGLTFGDARVGIANRSSHLELLILERVWLTIAPALRDLESGAVGGLRARREFRRCWGDRRLTARTIEGLVRAGTDPRRRLVQRPFTAIEERLEEHSDTVEHRAIAGFLRFLAMRARWCRGSALDQIRAVERDRRFRDQRVREGPTLYELEDRPRIERLAAAADRAENLERILLNAETLPFLQGVRPVLALQETPVFAHVAPYRRLYQTMFRYLTSSLLLLDTGSEERVKATSRMYEQWVLLQIVSAFSRAGLRCSGGESIVRQVTAERFTLDIDRGAQLTFDGKHGQRVKVRYEPWILSREEATAKGDTVYQGRSKAAPWCPDILVEVGSGGHPLSPEFVVEYAFVVDAKYTRYIKPKSWHETEKYREIRSVKDRRQVVKQIWLAHPDVGAGIIPRDPSVTWGAAGPDCPREDTIQGSVGLVPAEARDEEAIELVDLPSPVRNAQEFVNGMLRYLNFEISDEESILAGERAASE